MTDNRWSPGASGATVPDDTPAAYAARWIDRGDGVPADVLADRQGFAYSDPADRDRLIVRLVELDSTIRTLDGAARDVSEHVVDEPDWQLVRRRAGGYVYVDAWHTATAHAGVSAAELVDLARAGDLDPADVERELSL